MLRHTGDGQQAHIVGKQGSTSIVGQPACRPPIQAPAITTNVRGQVEHVLQRLPKAYAGSGPHLFALSVQIRHFRVVTPTKASKARSEEHTSELQSLMRISYAVFCLKKKKEISSHQHIH